MTVKNSFLAIIPVVLCLGCSGAATSMDGTVARAVAEPEANLNATGDVEAVRLPGTNISIHLVHVEGGNVTIGSPEPQATDEPASTTVTLSPYWIGQFEVSFDEYAVFRFPDRDSDSTATGVPYDLDAVARPSPPYEDPSVGMSEAGYPATGMTQWGALQYARWLSEKTGQFFRLPTEAEWEHACRLGRPGADLNDTARYLANSAERFGPIGSMEADALGLFDMLGNVSEWTLDEYREDWAAFLAEEPVDPWVQPAALHPRTVRGGAFDDDESVLRCGERIESTLSWKRRDPQIPKSFWWNTDSPFLGFRLVRPVNQPTAEEAAAFWAMVLGD